MSLVRLHARIETPDLAQAVGDGAGHFHSGKSAADNNEVTEAAAQKRFGFKFNLGQTPQHEIANVHRVADRLQHHGMLGHARNKIHARPVAVGEYEMIVSDLDFALERIATQTFRVEVDIAHGAHDKARASNGFAQGSNHVFREDGRANDLCQHRIERGVALLRYERDVEQLRLLLQCAREVRSGEAATDNDDVFFLRSHKCSPIWLRPRTHSLVGLDASPRFSLQAFLNQ